MLHVHQQGPFKEDWKRVKERGEDMEALKDVIRMLCRRESLPVEFRDHMLHSEYNGCRECHVGPHEDFLLIYRVSGNTLRLIRTGSHSELFKPG